MSGSLHGACFSLCLCLCLSFKNEKVKTRWFFLMSSIVKHTVGVMRIEYFIIKMFEVFPVPVWGLSFLVVSCCSWWVVTDTASRRQFENKVPGDPWEDNGIPVRLKGGVAGTLLDRATMMLTVGGTAYAMYQLAVVLFPRSRINFNSSQQAVGSVSFSSLWTSNR
ncbi:unnamed protein product [Nyctereutes procyonoides]|uniref:Cytochrome c oxidase subunit 7A2, mitochondrial n=1 Tax=Nyctereutes procyonoides TaxID=34880 RepID=A0A811YG00_NYCPR|nr:unnamed protein product [Nyctereutes procyonoides]